jgi:hypothetical protein
VDQVSQSGTLKGWLTAPVDIRKYLAGGLGSGAGAWIAYQTIQAVEHNPAFLPQLLNVGVLAFGFATVALVVFARSFSKFAEAQARTATALEDLAAHVGEAAAKDEQRVRENDILLNHLATTSEQTLQLVQAMKREQDQR